MAEINSPSLPTDWAYSDRTSFTGRWNDANVFNLMRPSTGYEEYRTISQRAAFYDWFDQIREVQGHEILWPAAAWVVAQQMSNVDKPSGLALINQTVRQFANQGNKAIFDDVFPRLADVFMRGLRNNALRGVEARNWDRETLRREQSIVVQPLYELYGRLDPGVTRELAAMAEGKGIYAFGGVAIGFALDFAGNIMNPMDRFNHGMNRVVLFYQRFKAAIDQSRRRRQVARPDPTARGRVRLLPAPNSGGHGPN
jgi:hypothetical protein